jgi:hypothetical protein
MHKDEKGRHSPALSKIAKVMRKWGKGEERSGSKKGPVVPHTKKGQKQALAIAYSEAKRSAKKR